MQGLLRDCGPNHWHATSAAPAPAPFVAPEAAPESRVRICAAGDGPFSRLARARRRPPAPFQPAARHPLRLRPGARICGGAVSGVQSAPRRFPWRIYWRGWRIYRRVLVPMAGHRTPSPGSRFLRVPVPRHPSLPQRRVQMTFHLPVIPPRLAFRRPEGLSRSVLSCAAGQLPRVARHGLLLRQD